MKQTVFNNVKRRSAVVFLLAGALLVFADSSLGLTTGARPSRRTAAPTFDSETAYLIGHRPNLARAVKVGSLRAFNRAIARAKGGQTIDVLGNVRIPGSFSGFNHVVRHGTVNVVFQRGAGFVGGKAAEPAVFLNNSGGWRLWGGTISNPGGNGIRVYAMPGPFTWTGFSVTNTGDTCVAVYPVGGNIDRLVLKGVAGTADPSLAFDPHGEKGTGIHAWNIADATGGMVENSIFAADTRDQATGAAVEIETDRVANVVVYARARNVGFALPNTSWNGDAIEQVAGNVIQLWGGSAAGRLDIRYAEGDQIQGRMVETNGVYQGADLSQVSVDYGRATGPILQNPFLSSVAYEVSGGLYLGDCLPLP
jgi:hypothetical protein